MKKHFWMTMLLTFSFAGVAFAHKGHGVVTHPVVVKWGLQGAREISNVHPLFVHFPIAFLLGATGFYFAGAMFRKDSLVAAGKWALFAGALTAIITVWTGLKAAEVVAHDEEVHQIMMKHQMLGFIVVGMSALLSLWVLLSKANIPVKGRKLFLAGLLLLSGVILQQADFGGRMVFLKGTGVKPGNSMVEEMATKHTESNAGNMKGMNMMMDHDHQ